MALHPSGNGKGAILMVRQRRLQPQSPQNSQVGNRSLLTIRVVDTLVPIGLVLFVILVICIIV
jgi:hypothetical protein